MEMKGVILITTFMLYMRAFYVSGVIRVPTVLRNSGECPSNPATQSLPQNIGVQLVQECGPGYWMEMANFNLTDSSQNCPSPWSEVLSPVRSCSSSCGNFSAFTPRFNYTYQHVCGRVTGYVTRSVDAFAQFAGQTTIDVAYLDGVSITYGSPRQHIWSFGAGHGVQFGDYRCPCDNGNKGEAPLPPSFVGENYFCDGEYNGDLWDGQNCNTSCCTFHSPPWFNVTLPTATSADIEVRICIDEAVDENVYVKQMQLYVQ